MWNLLLKPLSLRFLHISPVCTALMVINVDIRRRSIVLQNCKGCVSVHWKYFRVTTWDITYVSYRSLSVCLFQHHAKATTWIQTGFSPLFKHTAQVKNWDLFYYDRLNRARPKAWSLTSKGACRGIREKYWGLYIGSYIYSPFVADACLWGYFLKVNFKGSCGGVKSHTLLFQYIISYRFEIWCSITRNV